MQTSFFMTAGLLSGWEKDPDGSRQEGESITFISKGRGPQFSWSSERGKRRKIRSFSLS